MVLFRVGALASLIVLFVFVCLLVAKNKEEQEHNDFEQSEYIEKWKNKKGTK